jgi:hypothetical protein
MSPSMSMSRTMTVLALGLLPSSGAVQNRVRMSRRGFSYASALAACVAPAIARANILEGSSGLSGGDTADALSSGVVSAAKGVGIRPRAADGERPIDDLTTRLLKQSDQNRARNEAAIFRRSMLNSEGARIFPGDGLTVFENGVPFEVTMEEYEELLNSGRISRGSRDVKPATPK